MHGNLLNYRVFMQIQFFRQFCRDNETKNNNTVLLLPQR